MEAIKSTVARTRLVNVKIVLQIIGKLLIGLSMGMCLPLIMTYAYQEGNWAAFLYPALFTFGVGFFLSKIFASNDEMSAREGFAIVASVWVVFTIFGALPYYFCDSGHTYTDAFFQTISGFTTTGSSVFVDIESHSKSILFWGAITQWIGGMGIIVLSLAILPVLGIGGMQLFQAEVPGPVSDKLTPRIKDTAKILYQVYIFLTVIQCLLLWLAGMDLYSAVCHSLTTLSSGGFSPHNASLAHYDNSLIHGIVIVFMIFAGMNFSLHYRFSRWQFEAMFKDTEFQCYLGFIALMTAILVAYLMGFGTYDNLFLCIRDALFSTVSLITTTGFATADFEQWPEFCQAILFALFFAGGCAGSTGGGVKIIRWIIFTKFAYQQINQLLHPKAILNLKVSEQMVKDNVTKGVLGFLVIYVLSFGLGTILMALTGLDLLTAAAATATCLGNIGPGLAKVGPTDNFAAISDIGKWILSFLMLLGRLELFTVLVLFTPAFWRD